MKNIKISILAGLLLAGTSSFGAISGGPHDLSGAAGAADNGELCVYCHTPHAGNTLATVPIWNKGTNTQVYTMYGATLAGNATNTDGASDGGSVGPSNASLACLSCHDGVSSVDSIVNAPGSGLGSIVADTNLTSWVTTEGGTKTSGLSSTIANLTQDLTKTHPVSITYDKTAASLRDKTTQLVATDAVLWASYGTKTIDNILRAGKVECGSCHDPHNTSTQSTTQVNFLRVSNVGSKLCTTCHDK